VKNAFLEVQPQTSCIHTVDHGFTLWELPAAAECHLPGR
jgi:hypothetical protein